MRCVAIGRKNWTSAGSDAGGRRAAAIYTLIETCKLNDVYPRAWLADAGTPHRRPPCSDIDVAARCQALRRHVRWSRGAER